MEKNTLILAYESGYVASYAGQGFPHVPIHFGLNVWVGLDGWVRKIFNARGVSAAAD
jgi:hypothetical protein